MPDQDDRLAFLPFHALNRFMREDFQLAVVRGTILSMHQLPGSLRRDIERQVNRSVAVPGFRTGAKAPPALIARHLPEAFEKNPALVAAVLAGWAELHAALRQEVFDILVERGWELLPAGADRSKLPGFLTTWPPDEDFDKINQAYSEKHPEGRSNSDEVSLMAVWLSARLPLDQD